MSISAPFCVFTGGPEFAAEADRFMLTTATQPAIMSQALAAAKVTPTGEFLFGVPGERNPRYDPALADCIGAAALLLRGGADGYLHFDPATVQTAKQIETSRSTGKTAPTNQQAAIGRLSLLEAYARRTNDPTGNKAQAKGVSRRRFQRAA